MSERISDFMVWLGGADKTVLKKVPQARSRFAQMGGVLLTTAGIAAMSMTFALHDAVKAPWFVAGFIGFLWGGVILNLDRLLVLSIGSIRNSRHMLLMALPRLAMATVLAVVISTPLVLRIFQRDINNELFIMRQQASAQQKSLEANSNEQHEANQLNSKIAADNSILAGNLPVNVTSPELKTAQQKVATLQSQESSEQKTVDNDIEAYECEADGSGPHCAGATSKVGKGPIYKAKYLRYKQDLATLNSTKAQLRMATAQEQADEKQIASSQASILKHDQAVAKATLPGLQRQLKQVNAELQQQDAEGTAVNNSNTGLLAQIRALFAASGNNPALALAHLCVFLLFFMIEILPVTVKLLLSLDKTSPYDSVAKKRDDKIIDAMKIKRAEARQISEQKSQTRIAIESDMRKREVYLGVRANQYVEDELIKILDAALQRWGTQVTAQLSAGQPTAVGAAPPIVGAFPPPNTVGGTPPGTAGGTPPGAGGGPVPAGSGQAPAGNGSPPPGHAGPPPRHAAPPGTAGASPGQAGPPNGTAGPLPDQAGPPPGQAGPPNGQAGQPPRHAGAPLGHVQINTFLSLPDEDDI